MPIILHSFTISFAMFVVKEPISIVAGGNQSFVNKCVVRLSNNKHKLYHGHRRDYQALKCGLWFQSGYIMQFCHINLLQRFNMSNCSKLLPFKARLLLALSSERRVLLSLLNYF